jgi:hypothetical protein
VVTLKSPEGEYVDVSEEKVADLRAQGYTPVGTTSAPIIAKDDYTGEVGAFQDARSAGRQGYTRRATAADIENADQQRLHGDSDAIAFGEGVLRSVSFGTSDALTGALGFSTEDMRERKERNSGAALAGEITGALLPIPGSMGSMAGKAGAAVERAALGVAGREGAGLGTRLLSRGIGTATEGSIYGIGSGVSELALSDAPITAERVATVIGGHALYGGGIGGSLGMAGALLGEAAVAGKKLATETIGKLGRGMDDAAISAERQEIAAAFRAGREAPKDFFVAVPEGQQRKILMRSTTAMRRLGDQADYLAAKPGAALRPLYEHRQALDDVLSKVDDIKAGIQAEQQKLADAIPIGAEPVVLKGEAARKYADFAGQKLSKGKAVTLEPAQAQAYREALMSGRVASKRIAALDDVAAERASTHSMIERIEKLEESIKVAGKPGMGETAVSAGATSLAGGAMMSVGVPGIVAFPVANKLGEAAGALFRRKGQQLLGHVNEEIAKSQLKTAQLIDSVVSGAGRFAKKAPTVASLSSIRFAPPNVARPVKAAPSTKSAYKDREAELEAQTQPGPNGKPVIRMEAAREIHERLAPLWAIAPKLADNLEMMAIRRLEFMAGKTIPRPNSGVMQIGLDRWKPSDAEVAKFTRYADAVEGGPEHILSKAKHGKLTPEDAEVLREVYPETYEEIRLGIIQRLPEVKQMPYSRRLMLGILFDVPTDPALQPHVIAALQGSFAKENGSEGGTQSPAPKLASVSKPAPTQAQKLSE